VSEQSAIRNRQSAIQRGFTLLEVVVAVALVGLGLAAALEILAVGLRSARASGDYTQAVLLARQKLGELSSQMLTSRVEDGSFGEVYRWTAEVTPEDTDVEGLPVRLFRLRVKVSWVGKGGDKGVELVTLRGAEAEAPPPGGASPGGRRGAMR